LHRTTDYRLKSLMRYATGFAQRASAKQTMNWFSAGSLRRP
jgi:hypothetical protein